MAGLGIASMALGAASSIFGGIKAKKAQKKANAMRQAEKEADTAWYNRRYNENYADTAAGQQLITAAKDYARDNFQRAQGAAAVGGASTASAAAAKEAGNKVVANTLSNVAANDTARKDRVDAMHRNTQQQLTEQQTAGEENRGRQINAAATLAGNQLIQGGAALLQDSAKGTTTAKQTSSPSTDNTDTAEPAGDAPIYDTPVKPNTGDAAGTGADFWDFTQGGSYA